MAPQNNSIGKWADDDRPREKLLHKPPYSLSDSELLAILIGNGTIRRSAVELARDILAVAGNNLQELGKLTVKNLTQIRGIGQAKALTIAAAMELSRRSQAILPLDRPIMDSTKTAAAYFQALFRDYPYEVLAVLYLNNARKVKHFEIHSKGGITSTTFDNRLIFQKALEVGAVNIIIGHNHPSGDLTPSKADIDTSVQTREAGEIIDIRLLDDIIVSDQGYYSLKNRGWVFR